MPRKQRFKPSRKPKAPVEEGTPTSTQASPPGQRIPNEREREPVPADRSDVVIDHDRPR
jgi:hypothetical protein